MNAHQRRTARRASRNADRFMVLITRRAARRRLDDWRKAFPDAVAFWGDGTMTVTGRTPAPYAPPFHNFPAGRE